MKISRLVDTAIKPSWILWHSAITANASEIDALLAKDWQQHKLTPNPPASDETFVRRAHLDIIGRIPTMQEAQAFLASTDKDKRAKLIDTLLAGEGYVVLHENRGAQVAPMTHKTLRNFFVAAPMIYAAVTRLAAGHATPAQVARLKACQRAFRTAIANANAQISH